MLRIFQFVKKCNKNVTSNFWCYWLGIWLNTSEIFFGKRPLHTWQVLKITGQSDHSFMPKTTLTTVGLVHYNLRNNCRVGYPAVVYIRRHRAVRWNLMKIHTKKQVGLKMLRIFQFVKKCNKNVTSNFWCYWLGIWLNTSEIFFGKRPLHTWQVLKITGQSDHSFMPKTTLTTVGLVYYNLRNNCMSGRLPGRRVHT